MIYIKSNYIYIYMSYTVFYPMFFFMFFGEFMWIHPRHTVFAGSASVVNRPSPAPSSVDVFTFKWEPSWNRWWQLMADMDIEKYKSQGSALFMLFHVILCQIILIYMISTSVVWYGLMLCPCLSSGFHFSKLASFQPSWPEATRFRPNAGPTKVSGESPEVCDTNCGA